MKCTCPNCGHSFSTISSKKQSITFDGEHFQGITGELKYWTEQYPAIDIQSELRKMEVWLYSNPANRKKQYVRFISNWLTRAQDRAPRVELHKSIKPSYDGLL